MFAGIDLGANTGFAVLDKDGSRQASLTWRLGVRSGSSLLTFHDNLDFALINHGITMVGYEQIRQAHKSRVAACAYGAYEGILMLVCARLKLPLYGFFPYEIKRAATGFVEADKEDMEAMVFRRWGYLVDTHDEADAIFVAELTRLRANGQ